MSRRCVSGDTLSAFVDDALSGAERDQVASHLAECPQCRGEVASIRRLQRLLSSTRADTDRTPQLADRLVSIAGAEARQPLWSRPFDEQLGPHRGQPLPSVRRARRRNLGGAMLVLGTVMITLVGIGWVAAPPPNAEIVNPVSRARAEFSHVAAQRPFVMDSTVALLAMPAGEQDAFTRPGGITPLPVGPGPELTPAEAHTVLAAAEQSPRMVDHQGRQRVQLHAGGQHLEMQVEVAHHSGQGTQVEVLDGAGAPLRTAFLPIRQVNAVEWPRELTGVRDQRIGDLDAIMVEARRDGRLVTRWWFDDRTGLQLAQETYGSDGTLLTQAVVTDVQVHRQEFMAHVPPRLVRPAAAADLQLHQAAVVRANGWSCHTELAGLPLTRLGSNPGTSAHTTYSDGASAVTVRQERGTILQAPEGFVWDDEVGAYRRDGAPTMMIWQSQDSVFTVATDGSPELAMQAVRELPHESPVLRTRVGRVQEGWQHVLDVVGGR